METAAYLMGLVGVALLAVPALLVNGYARRVSRQGRLMLDESDPQLKRRQEQLSIDLAALRDGWTPAKQAALYGGLALSAAAPLLGLSKLLFLSD